MNKEEKQEILCKFQCIIVVFQNLICYYPNPSIQNWIMFNRLFNEGDQNKFPFGHERQFYLIARLLFNNYCGAPFLFSIFLRFLPYFVCCCRICFPFRIFLSLLVNNRHHFYHRHCYDKNSGIQLL